jgi:hypothetical protein
MGIVLLVLSWEGATAPPSNKQRSETSVRTKRERHVLSQRPILALCAVDELIVYVVSQSARQAQDNCSHRISRASPSMLVNRSLSTQSLT